MVVRVAQRVRSGIDESTRIVVAGDHPSIIAACHDHQVEAVLTREDHPSGSDRLAEASRILHLDPDEVVVNVQGDEPLIDPLLVRAVADQLFAHPGVSMGTAACAIDRVADFSNPNVVKVVLDAAELALYFSRAPIAWWRDGFTDKFQALPQPAPLRHIGIYAYRVGFLQLFPSLKQAPIELVESLEQLRAMWHGYRIAVHVTSTPPGTGVDTPEDLQHVRSLFG
jgi:3-deoxy-manno-octulosonate cytidylyltransferase (CMP-KDO synthetase)